MTLTQHFEQDTKGRDLELRYFRDVDGREVDFVVTERTKPILLVECKWADAAIDKSLRYLKAKIPDAAACQLSDVGTYDYQNAAGTPVAQALSLLATFVCSRSPALPRNAARA